MRKKKILLWIIAIIITLIAVFYQKITGPTYPKKVNINFNNKNYKIKLLRSHGGKDNAKITLNIPDKDINATLYYRHFPSNEKYIKINFSHEVIKQKKLFGKEKNIKVLTAELPNQPPAGKLQYYIVLDSFGNTIDILKNNPVVIRFKGAVPLWILIPHILLMFTAMLLSTLSVLYAIAKIDKFKLYAYITFFTLFMGGIIFGPIVQKYAFGELWTGVPFGWDLTDNKTLIAFIFWIIAILFNLKRKNRTTVIIAGIVLLLIYSIPHSMYGSELNRESGKIEQG